MPESILQPDGVGDVPCDSKWRLRLPGPYSTYFLAFDPEKDAAKRIGKVYTASLNGEDILIWPKSLLSQWRQKLPRQTPEEAKETRRILTALQFYGADAEIDNQGRFVLARTVRDALQLGAPPRSFKIYNDGIIRLVTHERFETAKREMAPPSAALDESAVTLYTTLIQPDAGIAEGGLE